MPRFPVLNHPSSRLKSKFGARPVQMSATCRTDVVVTKYGPLWPRKDRALDPGTVTAGNRKRSSHNNSPGLFLRLAADRSLYRENGGRAVVAEPVHAVG